MSNLKEQFRNINPNAITLSSNSSIPNPPNGYCRIWVHADGTNQTAKFNDGISDYIVGGANTISNLNNVTITSVMPHQHIEYNGAGQWINRYTAYEVDGSTNIKPCGVNNTVSGLRSTVVGGTSNTASGDTATTWGLNCSATNNYATAFGNTTIASGAQSTAWGNNTTANDTSSTAWGSTTTATGVNSTAFGNGSDASNDQSTAWGTNTTASGVNSTAWGNGSTATNNQSTAWGNGADATGPNSTAWGNNTTASGTGSTAFGNAGTSIGDYSTSFGDGNSASGTYSVCAGGKNNTIQSSANNSGIFCGTSSLIQTNTECSVVIGGTGNTANNSNTVYITNLTASGLSLIMPNLPTYNNGTDAAVLPLGALYKTSNGEVRITVF